MGKTLSARNLAAAFGLKAEVARHTVRTLCHALGETELSAVQRSKTLVARPGSYDPKKPSAAIARLAGLCGLDAAKLKPETVLFALHTYYALLVRLLVGRFGELRAIELDADSPFSWPFDSRSEAVTEAVDRLEAAMGQYDARTLKSGPADDLLSRLYQELVPRRLRHELGEYYTPGWLADHVLDQVGYRGDAQRRLLDPACGSGTFLLKAVARIRATAANNNGPDGADAAASDKRELLDKILRAVVGFDLNPLAVLAVRANYLIAVRDLLPPSDVVEIPVYLRDSILDGRPCDERFDYIVGNPPWIAWDNLPAAYRRATRPLWERYGLFSLSGKDARHGGGKKDLSMLMLFTAADRYLRSGGRLAFVITQTVFQSKGAGDGFRRFRLGPEGEQLRVLRVDDMVAVRPFADAANWTATIVLEKGAPTEYPLPYFRWLPDGDRFRQRKYRAEPIDSGRPGSPWFLRPGGLKMPLSRLVGPSAYTARLGANSGGANGVYWLELLEKTGGGVRVRNLPGKGKSDIRQLEQVVEPDLIYPLARWADVARFRATPSTHILLVQNVETRTGIDEAVMRRDYARTYAYLRQFESPLRARAAYRRYQGTKAFYSMYNVGVYTVAPIKVVWRRMDRRINAAVVGEIDDPLLARRPIVPQETCAFIAADSTTEAHYLCAVLNSSIVNFLVTSHSVSGGKGFGTPGMLDFIKLRRFDPANLRHQVLAAWSCEAHQAAANGDDVEKIVQRINPLAADLWGLSEAELAAIHGTHQTPGEW